MNSLRIAHVESSRRRGQSRLNFSRVQRDKDMAHTGYYVNRVIETMILDILGR